MSPKFPFVLQILGRDFEVTRAPLKDCYGESEAWRRRITINVADGEFGVPDDRVMEVLAHEVMHMALAVSGHADEDNSTTLDAKQEEAVCIVAEAVWIAMQSVPQQRGRKPNT